MTRRSVSIVLGMAFFLVLVLWMARPSVEPPVKEAPEVVRTVRRVPQATVIRTVAIPQQEVAQAMTVSVVRRAQPNDLNDNVERDLQEVGMSLKGGHQIGVR